MKDFEEYLKILPNNDNPSSMIFLNSNNSVSESASRAAIKLGFFHVDGCTNAKKLIVKRGTNFF